MDIEKTYRDPAKASPLIETVNMIVDGVLKVESENPSFIREFVSALRYFSAIYQRELPTCWPSFCLNDYRI